MSQHITIGTSETLGGGSVGAVIEASDNMGHHGARLAVLEIVALIAINATSQVIDGGALGATRLDATTSYRVVEIVGVAVRAVEIVLPLEASSGRDGVVSAGRS